ncbi:hypothetical protein AMATHDRAFT_137918 [Amanita thiersii Skay4041]|uniref:DNA polymerase alpha subunit B n=1 Tax=Amanita thiersii Skay4041 TaxID=703135 RepID=A0A2A9NY58_9AGAR|nr:hypothetical protein AMATHDRAFT_137918 [Amanita thiersii Skay4041]
MTQELREGVSRVFADRLAGVDDKLIQECGAISYSFYELTCSSFLPGVSLCELYNMTPENFLWKWEASNVNFNSRSQDSELKLLTSDSIVAVKTLITRELLKDASKRKQPRTNATVLPANLKDSRFPTKGDSVSYRGPATDVLSRKKRAFRYMYEKVSERSEVLDERIEEIAELVREHYKISDFSDPSASTDEEVIVVGRIVQEAEAASSSSKLNDATIHLESSRMHGSGSRVPLRFSPFLKIRGCIRGAKSVGFFPGAITVLKGKNGGGGWFQVSEILGLPPPAPLLPAEPSHSKMELGMGGLPFSMCVACGPYTTDSNLQYKPRDSLFEYLKNSKPKVVLIMGPFVDSAHPRIKAGDADYPPSRIYQARFLNPLIAFLKESPESIVLLLPHVRDLLSDRAVYPQTEYPQHLTGDHPQIHLLPNPARFSINGVNFGATSVDVLFHLKREEFLKRGEEVTPIPPTSVEDTGADGMGNLCRYLLQQRSFYPLFPVPLDVSHEVNLDISHSEGLRMCDTDQNKYAPDILLVPSKLKEFCKTVHSTIAINPSYLSRARYATINVSAGTTPAMDRVKVELSKFKGGETTG